MLELLLRDDSVQTNSRTAAGEEPDTRGNQQGLPGLVHRITYDGDKCQLPKEHTEVKVRKLGKQGHKMYLKNFFKEVQDETFTVCHCANFMYFKYFE